MAFNNRLFWEQIQHSLSHTEGTPARLTPRRILFLTVFFPIFTIVRLINWIGLKLDDLLARDYQQQEVQQPVFILGNPRSGTTFLHRLMAKDRRSNFLLPAHVGDLLCSLGDPAPVVVAGAEDR